VIRFLLVCAAIPLGNSANAQMSNNGWTYLESTKCGDLTATLAVNHDMAVKPTLFIGDDPIELPNGPNYLGPFCLTWNDMQHVGFTEYLGNAYEIYRLVDPQTLVPFEITFSEAEKIGWWD
jgi:hypothetical protein